MKSKENLADNYGLGTNTDITLRPNFYGASFRNDPPEPPPAQEGWGSTGARRHPPEPGSKESERKYYEEIGVIPPIAPPTEKFTWRSTRRKQKLTYNE
jgi:hypothetical protein